jgi:hypothetical protein
LQSGEDWRNVAIRDGLMHLYNAEWLWFTEQDFTPRDGFWDQVDKLSEHHDVIGIKQGDRLHPACLFIKREKLNTLRRDFAANPPYYDHFGAIQKQLDNYAVIDPMYWHHYNGLSHNWRLISDWQKIVYEPEAFKTYLRDCIKCKVEIAGEFVKVAQWGILKG